MERMNVFAVWEIQKIYVCSSCAQYNNFRLIKTRVVAIKDVIVNEHFSALSLLCLVSISS